jgi:addiction module HigA family antidote
MAQQPEKHSEIGDYIRQQVIPVGMSVKEAASRLGVSRPTLSNLLNGKASLSPDMAGRLEKSFGAERQKLLDIQSAADRKKQRQTEKAVAVRKYVPNFLSIKATQIRDWADGNLDARKHLPVLLRRLVHSTGQDLHRVDFPGYDNAERKGSDGVIEAAAATAWIPEGTSYWEFGVTENPKTKAEKDYAARLASVSAAARSQSTFVFVTPRNWPGKDAWVKAKNAAGDWKIVRALDASDLEQWLEESVPGQIWLAEKLGLPTTGHETLEGRWERWAAGSQPRMTPEIFAPSVAAHGKTFKDWLAKQPDRPFIISADSRDEALAFLTCLFRDIDPESQSMDLAAVFDAAPALRTLASSSSPFIPIVTTDEAERELASVYRDYHSIIVRPRTAVDSSPDIALDLLRYESFEKALAAMNITGDAVERLARESGRSPTILRRRLSHVDAIKTPAWAKDSDTARALIPMVLVGAWNPKSAADTEILSVLANRPYEKIEEDVARLLQFDDPPVWSAGNYRGVASKIDLIFAISKFVTQKDLSEFFTLAEYVLSEFDPAVELPEDDRWAAGIYGKVRDHSAALREGICETLIILSVHGNNLFKYRLGIDVDARVAVLIRQLLSPLTLDKLMSHDRDLPRYAEAAPETFLALLEADLKKTDPVVLGLLKPASSGPFGKCLRAGLLWALECLAWKPQNLPRVVALLAELSRTDINDNWANKPIGSLKAIFRSWMPQTAASLEERLKVLELLTKRFPDIGWQICIEQFNSGSRTGDYSYGPRWRSDASGAGKPLDSWDPIIAFNRKALDIALAWPAHDESTFGDLVERLEGMTPEDQEKLWQLIENWADDANTIDKARATLRERIRRFALTRVGRRRVSEEAARKRARDMYTKLEPTDPVIQHGWLFAKQWVEESAEELDEDDFDYTKREERIHALRIAALTDIWSGRGFEGVLELLADSEAAMTVGRYAALCIIDPGTRADFLLRCLAVSGSLEHKADSCMLGFLWALELGPRQASLRAVAQDIDSDNQARLFRSAPFEKDTWRIADEYGEDVAKRYWKEVLPQSNRRHPDADLNELVDRLLDAERPRAAFYAAHMDWARLETSRLKRLLTMVATVDREPQKTYRLDAHDVSDALDALDARTSVTPSEMALMEFRFVGALDRSKHGIPNLERQISDSPHMYMQAMALMCKRSDNGEDPPEWRIDDPERRASIGSAMHRVLDQMKRIPGTNADGVIVAGDLVDFLNQARALATQHGRAAIVDQCLGQLLAKAPSENNGVWPCVPVCDAMEQLASTEIAIGFLVGVRNSRGAVWRGEGGAQERESAAKYRSLSQRVALEYPYVANVLEDIAVSYDRQAEWHDLEAKVSKRLRY